MRRFALVFVYLIAASTGVLGGFFAYNIYIPEKIEDKVLASITLSGFEDAQIESITRKPGLMSFENITLDKDGFNTIQSLNVTYGIWSFFTGGDGIKAINIISPRFSGLLDENFDISIYGLKTDAFWNELGDLSARKIDIQNARIDVLSNHWGGLTFHMDGQITFKDHKNIELTGNIKSKQKRFSFFAKVNGKIVPGKGFTANLQTEQVAVNIDPLHAMRGVGTLKWVRFYGLEENRNRLEGTIDFPAIRWNGLPAQNVKVDVKHRLSEASKEHHYKISGLTSGNERIDWTANIQTSGDQWRKTLVAKPANIKHVFNYVKKHIAIDIEKALPSFITERPQPVVEISFEQKNKGDDLGGLFKLSFPDVPLDVEGKFKSFISNKTKKRHFTGVFLSPRTTIAPLEDPNSSVFNLTSSGEFEIAPDKSRRTLAWSGRTKLADTYLDLGILNLPNIQAHYDYSSATSYDDTSQIALPLKLPLRNAIKQNGAVILNMDTYKRPLIERAILDIYDGQILIEDFTTAPDSKSQKGNISVSDITLSTLISDLGFSGVTMVGKMGGLIPYTVKDTEDGREKMLEGGILQSQNPGVIKLPSILIESLYPEDTEENQAIRDALDNFHYEFFEIRFDGNPDKGMMLSISAQGNNPDLNRKEPLDITLQVETQLTPLLQSLMQ